YLLFFFSFPRAHRALHSFPTRRSSDLNECAATGAPVSASLLGCGGHGQPPLCPSDGKRRPESEKSLGSLSASRRLPPFRSTHSRSEEHTSELQSRSDLVCRLLLEKKKK